MTNTTNIPDEAMQAALDAVQGNIPPVMLEKALHAALPHLSAPCAVEVKKLEWTEHVNLWHCDKNPEYQITRWWLDEIRKQGACFEVLEIGERQLGTLEEAKAAAQADFERRILSCVVAKHDGQEAPDFEAIGRAYMSAFETITSENSEWSGYTPSECPSELLLDIYAAQQEAKPVDAPTKEERHANTVRNLIINQTSTDLEQIIYGHDPEQSILNNDVWDRLDKMACEIEALTKPVDVAAARKQAFEEGFENGVEQSLNSLNACDDITRIEAEQSIMKLKPDYRALSAAPTPEAGK